MRSLVFALLIPVVLLGTGCSYSPEVGGYESALDRDDSGLVKCPQQDSVDHNPAEC